MVPISSLCFLQLISFITVYQLDIFCQNKVNRLQKRTWSLAFWEFRNLKVERPFLKVPIEIFDNFLMTNMKDRWKPKRKLFTVCWYLLPFLSYELSKSRKSWEKMRTENWAFCVNSFETSRGKTGKILSAIFHLDSEVKLAQRLELNFGSRNNQGNTNSVRRSFICATAVNRGNQSLKLVWINKHAKYD